MKAVIIGATGLIGSHLVQQLIQDADCQKIILPIRREFEFPNSSKIETVVVDFSDKEKLRTCISNCDAVFCTVGTTQKKVHGDMELYRKVDYDIPVLAAKICEEENIPHYLLVTAVGADKQSNNFYLRLKGEVEATVQSMKIPHIAIFRPSMLLGERQEFRLAELIGKKVMQAFAFLIPARYKGVQAAQVANAMIQISKSSTSDFRIYENEDLLKY